MLKAIVFDFDGVIVDSEPLHYRAFLEVAQTFGVTFDYKQYLQELVGYDDRDGFRVLLGHRPGEALSPDEAARVEALCEQKQDAFERLVDAGVEAIPGALELWDEARAASMPVAIASGATTADIDLILRGLGRREHADAIVSADRVRRSKPDPESYRLAVQELAAKYRNHVLRAEECLAIEDTAAGLASAKGAGLMTLGLATTGPADRLHAAQRVVPDLAEVTLATLRQWYG